MLKPEKKQELWKLYKAQGSNALKANHYILAATTTEKDPAVWKEFLMEPDVNDYITQETTLLQQAEFRHILLNTDRDNSAGRAQLINAMMSVNQRQTKKDGPVVIYSYVPLNEQQLKSANVEINKTDIFRRN